MEKSRLEICDLGARNVVIKGGHFCEGDAVDVLYAKGKFYHLKEKRVQLKHPWHRVHFSSAIAAYLARGCDVYEAVKRASDYITGAIEHALDIGHGVGPTNHFYHLYYQSSGIIKGGKANMIGKVNDGFTKAILPNTGGRC